MSIDATCIEYSSKNLNSIIWYGNGFCTLCKMADEYKKVPIRVLNNSRFSDTDDSYNFE